VHFNKSFSKSGLSKADKEAEALRFMTTEWLQPKQVAALREWGADSMKAKVPVKKMYRQLRFYLGMAGVQSYWAARAMLKQFIAEAKD
jgi:hypothetical protein